jgi:hypothetical protein
MSKQKIVKEGCVEQQEMRNVGEGGSTAFVVSSHKWHKLLRKKSTKRIRIFSFLAHRCTATEYAHGMHKAFRMLQRGGNGCWGSLQPMEQIEKTAEIDQMHHEPTLCFANIN